MKGSLRHDIEHALPIPNRLIGSVATPASEVGSAFRGDRSRIILGMRIDATSYRDAVVTIASWAKNREPRYVCVSTVYMVMEGHDSVAFRAIVSDADLVTPDGMPLVCGLT
jgi:N-acetylglucosaminyldiphosphoundecaprenol N-acetyl-beta-D-mannosaminyltransferase